MSERKPVYEFLGQPGPRKMYRELDRLGVLTISPGGAGALLGLTRQRIHQLWEGQGKVTTWLCRVRPGGRVTYVELLWDDVVELARERGLTIGPIQAYEDLDSSPECVIP